MKYPPINISRKVSFCLILLFLGLMTSSVTHAENYTYVRQLTNSLNNPQGVAVDSTYVYVIDTDNSKIQRMTSSTGSWSNNWKNTGLSSPHGIGLDSSGHVYVANTGNGRVSRMSSTGTWTDNWVSSLSNPSGLAVTASYVYVTSGNNILKYNNNPTPGTPTTITHNFNNPQGIAVDSSGNLYVADTGNSQIQKLSGGTWTTWTHSFNKPRGVTVDSLGNVYVVDTDNHQIQKFNSAETWITTWTNPSSYPCGIAVNSSGYIYVADTSSDSIQIFGIAPSTNFTTSVTSGVAPLSVLFTDKSLYETSRKWDFGDGTNSTSATVTHTYNTAGNYVVNLTASNANGTDSKLATIIVFNSLPIARATSNVTSGSLPLTVQFNDLSIGNNITSWLWNFGDGTTSTERNTTKTYTTAGIYNANLTVTNDGGSNKSSNIIINVDKATPTITWSNPANITEDTPLEPDQLNATASVPGNFTYIYVAEGAPIVSGYVLPVGTHTLRAEFTPSDTVNYKNATADVQITVTPLARALTITKTANPTTYNAVDQVITYNYTVTNIGGVSLSDIAITDNKTTVTLESSGTLAPGSSVTGTAQYTINQSDIDTGFVTNSATATGTDGTQTIISNTVTATVESTLPRPALAITKVADPLTYNAAGQTITYTYTVTNTGNVPIGGIAVADNRTTVNIISDTLAPGSSATGTVQYTIKQEDVDAGLITNSATATGVYEGQTVTSNTVNATVYSTFVAQPALTITKVADPLTYDAAGQTITYTYIVNNTGNVPISGIAVTDNRTTVNINSDTLAPGSSVTGTGTYTTKQEDVDAGLITNSATATGTYGTQTITSDPANATVFSTFVANPALSITKTADQETYNAAGRTITYTYVVNNTGNVPITDIAVSDDKISGISLPQTTLAPGKTGTVAAQYITTPDDITAGSIINTASATGKYNTQDVTADPVSVTVSYVEKTAPTITWSPSDIYYGTALNSTQLNAIATDPVTGATVHGTFTYNPAEGTILDVGQHTLTVDFVSADDNFSEVKVSVPINVLQAIPTITWPTPADIPYGTPLSNAQLNANATYNGNPVAGGYVYVPNEGEVLSPGQHTLTVDFLPSDSTNFAEVVSTVQINVLQITPTIIWNNPADIVYGTILGEDQLNAYALYNGDQIDGYFEYYPPTGTVLDAGQQTLTANFIPADANIPVASSSVQINVTPAIPEIMWYPEDMSYGTPLGDGQLNAYALYYGYEIDGTFNYTLADGTPIVAGVTVLPAGTQTLKAIFTPSSPNYNIEEESVQINVEKMIPTIIWNDPADINYLTPLSDTQLNATAWCNGIQVDGNFSYILDDGSADGIPIIKGVTVLPLGTHTLIAAFTPTDTNTYYNAQAIAYINVVQTTPVITWSNPADMVYGTSLGPDQLNATASFNGITIAGTHTYSPAAGTVLGAGLNQTLTVHFVPDDPFIDEASGNVLINVLQATPEITWNLANITYGTALGDAQLNATASFNGTPIDGTYAYDPAAGTILPAGQQQNLSVVFTPTDTVNYTTASKSLTFDVPAAIPLIAWDKPTDIVYGTPLSSTQLNATAADPVTGATVPGSFTYDPAEGTILPVGTHTLNATFIPSDVNYTTGTATVQINVTSATPVITWDKPVDIVYGTALSDTQLNATANVSGSFVYDPAEGTILPVGTYTLNATFTPTDANYITQTASVQINVTSATSVITWDQPADIVYGTALSITQLNATAADSVTGATVPGTFTYDLAEGTILSVGTHKLNATFTPSDANYSAGVASVQINVTSSAPVITWNKPSDIVYGTALSVTQLNATAADPVTVATILGSFTYDPAEGTVLPVGTHTLNATFTPGDANYTTQTASVQLNVTSATPVITWDQPADIVSGTALSSTQLNATANIGGSFVYDPAEGTVLPVGTHTLNATFTPTDANYTSQTASVQINVTSVAPVITWSNPANITIGTPLSSTQLNATANVAGTFVYDPANGTVLPAGTHTLNVSFTPSDANYSIGTASVTINVLNIPTFPGSIRTPEDLDGDGLYEDVNGNGELDYNDVLLVFRNMYWIEQNSLIPYLDFNHNDDIDYNDVLRLFRMVQ